MSFSCAWLATMIACFSSLSNIISPHKIFKNLFFAAPKAKRAVGEAPFGLVSAGCASAHTNGIIPQTKQEVKSFLKKIKTFLSFFSLFLKYSEFYRKSILQKFQL